MIRWRIGRSAGRNWNGTPHVLNGNGSGRSVAIASEANGAGSAITDILDTYDQRADAAIRQRKALQVEREIFRTSADHLLETVIEPTLEAIGEEVVARGHLWTVEERIDIQAQPAVACLFRPHRPDMSGGPASELTFRCLFPDRLSTSAVIHGAKGAEEVPARSHQSTSVTEAFVRTEAARFINLVLGEG